MRKLLVALILLLSTSAFGAEVDSNSPIHYGASAIIGLGTTAATAKTRHPNIYSMGLCMVPGVGKELSDSKFSWGDIAFDFAGCGTGLLTYKGINILAREDRIILVWRH